MALTLKDVSKAKNPGRYGDGHGLYMQVNDTGKKVWLFRYERLGRERWLGLGPCHTFTATEARERARRARQQLLDGIDPLEGRKTGVAARAIEAAMLVNIRGANGPANQYWYAA